MASALRLRYKNFMDRILEEELNQFSKKHDHRRIFSNLGDDFVNGNVCFKTVPNRTSIQHLLRSSRIVQENREIRCINAKHYDRLFNKVTNTIINIKDAGNLEACLAKAYSIKAAIGDNLYGILLIDGSTIINPFHPLVAMSLLSDKILTQPSNNYRMAVYTYPTEEIRNDLFKHYQEHRASKEIIETNINNQIITFANKIKSEVRVDNVSNNGGESIQIKYVTKKHHEEDVDVEYYITAQQILTLGIVMPYYGTSVIRVGEETGTHGIGISPMLSSNISSYTANSDQWENKNTKFENVETPYDSVCTGNTDSKTLEGLRTLTHSNASSALADMLIQPGALTYAKMCIEKSIEIYLKSNLIKDN